jgi:hypothetical protein
LQAYSKLLEPLFQKMLKSTEPIPLSRSTEDLEIAVKQVLPLFTIFFRDARNSHQQAED